MMFAYSQREFYYQTLTLRLTREHKPSEHLYIALDFFNSFKNVFFMDHFDAYVAETVQVYEDQYIYVDDENGISSIVFFSDLLDRSSIEKELALDKYPKRVLTSLAPVNPIRINMMNYEGIVEYYKDVRDEKDYTLSVKSISEYEGDVSTFVIMFGDSSDNERITARLTTRSTLIFYNKSIIDELLKSIEVLRSFGWKVEHSPCEYIKVDD